ncbi:MAG: hypothetical protein AAFP90_18720, partial [Planctomycetota bacterium]
MDTSSAAAYSLSSDPIFGSVWLVLLLAVAVVALLWCVPPRSVGMTPRRRRTLLALRSVAALCLLLAMLRPAMVRRDQRPTPATLPVLIDTSRSMLLSAGDGGSRWNVQKRVWDVLNKSLGDSVVSGTSTRSGSDLEMTSNSSQGAKSNGPSADESLAVTVLGYDAAAKRLSKQTLQNWARVDEN